MQTRVSQWGNSLGIRIPKTIAKEMGIHKNSTFDLSINGNQIVLRIQKKNLHDMLSSLSEEQIHEEQDFGSITGKEIW